MALIRATSGSGGSGGSNTFLLFYGRGERVGDSFLYKDTNYDSYLSDAYNVRYQRDFTFLKHVKGILICGPYTASVTTSGVTLTQIINDSGGPNYIYEFEANINDILYVKNGGSTAFVCEIFITEEL